MSGTNSTPFLPQEELIFSALEVRPKTYLDSRNSKHKCVLLRVFLRDSPSSVVTLGVLTVVVKWRCLIEVLHRGVQRIRCYLQCIHAFRNPRSALRLRRLTKSGWPERVLVVTALLLRIVVTFRGRPRALVVHSRLFVTGTVQGIGAVLLRCVDFVAGAVLCGP